MIYSFIHLFFVPHFDQHYINNYHQGSVISRLIFCTLFLLSSVWSTLHTLSPFSSKGDRLPRVHACPVSSPLPQSHAPLRSQDHPVSQERDDWIPTAIGMTSQYLRVRWGHGREGSLFSLGSREGFQEEVTFECCLESWARSWQVGKGVRCQAEVRRGYGWRRGGHLTHIH